MYQVKCDNFPLYDYRDPELILENPQIAVEVNTIGSGSFSIYNNHPYYSNLQKMKSVFEVRDEIGVVFRGRMTNDSMDFENVKDVELEGALAYFNDSVVRPYAFPDDFLEDADYISASESGNVVEFFLKWFIDNHNSQVEPFQQFKLGNVTVSDPNNYITRSNEKHSKSWAELKSKLFESALGGYLCIRYEEDGNYIDYLSEFTLTNTQKIEFGKNLLDLKRDSDASGIFTALIPIGAEIETETEILDEETGETTTITTKSIVDIEGIADGDIDDDIVKTGDTIYSKSGVAQYGWIYADVESTTWDDVTDSNNLLSKAVSTLKQEGLMFNESVEYNAVDLHFTDAEIRSLRIYRNVNVNSLPHGQSGLYPLTRLEIPLLKPQDTKITVGGTRKTLTDRNNNKFQTTMQRVESAEKDIAENRGNVTEVQNQVAIQRTQILNDAQSIILKALEGYVTTDSFSSFKETYESDLELNAQQMNLKFSETTEKINNVDGDLQEKFNQVTKYFTFNVDGLVIGEVDNPNKVIIDNDDITIEVNGEIVQRFDASGKSLIPLLTVTKTFTLLGYLIDQDEDGNVNCEYVGGVS